jgi:hypothetical protein
VFLQKKLDDDDLRMAFVMCQVKLAAVQADGARYRDGADKLRLESKRMAATAALLVLMGSRTTPAFILI